MSRSNFTFDTVDLDTGYTSNNPITPAALSGLSTTAVCCVSVSPAHVSGRTVSHCDEYSGPVTDVSLIERCGSPPPLCLSLSLSLSHTLSVFCMMLQKCHSRVTNWNRKATHTLPYLLCIVSVQQPLQHNTSTCSDRLLPQYL